ncbi:MAG TPA: hypothetical protein VH601_00945, partial [Bryobacteraceae bacterium]
IQYPPGLPAVVAAEELVLRTSNPAVIGIWLRRSWFVLSLLYVLFAFRLGRLFLSRRYALLLSGACLLNYEMYFVSTLNFAELPFAVSSTIFGYFYLRKARGWPTNIFVPLSAVVSYLLRSIGIALLAAWIADAALRRRYRQAAIRTAVALIPVISWQYYIHSVESGHRYQHPYYAYQRDPSMFYNVSYATNISLKSPFQPEKGLATKRDLLVRFVTNFIMMPRSLGEAISAKEGFWKGHLTRINRFIYPFVIPSWSIQVALSCLGLIVLAGMGWQLWHREWFISIYLSVTIAAVCMTTWRDQFPRYLAPAEPFLLLVFLVILLNVKSSFSSSSRRSHRFISAVAGSFALFVLCESALSCFVGYRNFRYRAVYVDKDGVNRGYTLFHYPEESSASEMGLKWLVTHVDPRAIVAVSMPQWVYLKTGLKTVMPPLEPDPVKAQKLIDTVPATYAALDELLMEDDFNKRFPALVRSSPDKWRLVYLSPHGEFDIYQRIGLSSTANSPLLEGRRTGSLRF